MIADSGRPVYADVRLVVGARVGSVMRSRCRTFWEGHMPERRLMLVFHLRTSLHVVIYGSR